MESYILKNPDSFNLVHIFECGQCFRWNKQDDGSYIGVIENSVIKVIQEEDKVIFTGKCINSDFKELINYYFDLNTNYSEYKKILSLNR